MSTQYERTFHFDSRLHPGCRVLPLSHGIEHLMVTEQHPETEIFSVEDVFKSSPEPALAIKGASEVFGELQFRNPDFHCQQDQPFDLRVAAYSPLLNQDYELVLEGIWIIEMDGERKRATYQAAKLVPWKTTAE